VDHDALRSICLRHNPRSGRFGRYIPIGPPDFEESVGIIGYYLGKLTAQCGQGSRIRITVPDHLAVKDILKPLFEEKSATQNRSCGADLEEVVNRAYLRSARRAVPDGESDRESETLSVCLTAEELGESLNEVPRSVTWNMMRRFHGEITKYCGSHATEPHAALHSEPVP
jgi:SpoVK/Ycf46/Vps4 family AAA+-type ATPase